MISINKLKTLSIVDQLIDVVKKIILIHKNYNKIAFKSKFVSFKQNILNKLIINMSEKKKFFIIQ